MRPRHVPALLLSLAALLLPQALHAQVPVVEENPFLEWGFDEFTFKFLARLIINFASVIVLIGCIYHPAYRKKDYFFTFFMFNITIFFITFFLNKVEMSTGAAFGLFAVFSLLRYRTEDIETKDMTYLFVVIAIGLLTAVNNGNLIEMILVNAAIILSAFLLDGHLILKAEMVKTIQYDDVSKIRPEQEKELIEDLRRRTGLDIHKAVVGKVDYLRDAASIKVYYYEPKAKPVE